MQPELEKKFNFNRKNLQAQTVGQVLQWISLQGYIDYFLIIIPDCLNSVTIKLRSVNLREFVQLVINV